MLLPSAKRDRHANVKPRRPVGRPGGARARAAGRQAPEGRCGEAALLRARPPRRTTRRPPPRPPTRRPWHPHPARRPRPSRPRLPRPPPRRRWRWSATRWPRHAGSAGLPARRLGDHDLRPRPPARRGHAHHPSSRPTARAFSRSASSRTTSPANADRAAGGRARDDLKAGRPRLRDLGDDRAPCRSGRTYDQANAALAQLAAANPSVMRLVPWAQQVSAHPEWVGLATACTRRAPATRRGRSSTPRPPRVPASPDQPPPSRRSAETTSPAAIASPAGERCTPSGLPDVQRLAVAAQRLAEAPTGREDAAEVDEPHLRIVARQARRSAACSPRRTPSRRMPAAGCRQREPVHAPGAVARVGGHHRARPRGVRREPRVGAARRLLICPPPAAGRAVVGAEEDDRRVRALLPGQAAGLRGPVQHPRLRDAGADVGVGVHPGPRPAAGPRAGSRAPGSWSRQRRARAASASLAPGPAALRGARPGPPGACRATVPAGRGRAGQPRPHAAPPRRAVHGAPTHAQAERSSSRRRRASGR